MDNRVCQKCGEEKLITEFYKYKVYRGSKVLEYHRRQCKVCENRRSRDYHNQNKSKRSEQHKAWRNRAVFGLADGEYEKMLDKQNGVCAICHNKCSTKPSLAVDHDHKTGLVRGLLCSNCNNGLGRFRDSVEILSSAIKYLT